MKILLTGANSYVGARLFLDLSKKFEVVGTYHENKLSEKLIHLNITDSEEIKKIIDKQKPEIIIHAASNANARWCEANPKLAIALNQEPTLNIVESANNINAKVIFISSYAAAIPNNVYGKTKYQSEKYVKRTKKGFVIIRPSLLIGFSPNTINDRPFNRILKNLDLKTEAIYDTSWKFQPSYLGHVSEVIAQVIKNNILNETISVAVPELKTRYDIAKDILGTFHIEVKPIDKKDTTNVIIDDLKALQILKLPQYSYGKIISKIIDEIKHREFFSTI
ncbi:MAG: sugar nucleotide-binding protein [Candidatus Levybacteria bacterium]|nr:sugar nucleotide-binding protein [Candidatus Levybacteria bacterium]